jgi:chromosome partitioning protein
MTLKQSEYGPIPNVPRGTCGCDGFPVSRRIETTIAKIIAIANQKGGVGKTTTAVNLSASLAVQEQAILLIDLDPQANTTSGLGIEAKDVSRTIYHCLTGQTKLAEVIVQTSIPKLQIVPANADLVGAEIELVSLPEREQIFKHALQEVTDQYDYILVDCPPALGLLTINALTAASSLLIPVQAEYYAMEGLGRLMATVQRVQRSFNPALELEGILLTMFDARTSLARQVADEIRGHFKEKVYETIIPRNITLAEAPSYGRPVLLYNADSVGAQAYVQLAKEFLKHGEKSAR